MLHADLGQATKTIKVLTLALARSAGERVPATGDKPPLYQSVWTDRGELVWDGSEWRPPYTSAGNLAAHPLTSRWTLKRLRRQHAKPDPLWWLRERR